jgi:protein-tyrosine phosphatase
VRIAMVCLGNICRSPMAEAVARAMFAAAGVAGITVESFGTSARHSGDGIDRRADAALRRRGWATLPHRARQLTGAELDRVDLVLCMDRANLAAVRAGVTDGSTAIIELLRAYDPASGPGDDEVADPWTGGPADFDRALELIERSCAGLVDRLAAPGGAAKRWAP